MGKNGINSCHSAPPTARNAWESAQRLARLVTYQGEKATHCRVRKGNRVVYHDALHNDFHAKSVRM